MTDKQEDPTLEVEAPVLVCGVDVQNLFTHLLLTCGVCGRGVGGEWGVTDEDDPRVIFRLQPCLCGGVKPAALQIATMQDLIKLREPKP